MEQKTRFTLENLPFDKLEKVGVQKDFAEKMEQQERYNFLNGYRSQKLYTINAKINNEEYKIPAKLRLYGDSGNVQVRVHPIQRLHIPDQYMGHTFSKEERDALIKDKNLGKVMELTDLSGKKEKYYLGIKKKTNEVIPMKQKHVRINDKIKGAT